MDHPRPALPAPLQALVLPWWRQRALDAALALEGALADGETTVEWGRRRVTVERLAEIAEEADAMAARLAVAAQ